MCIQCPKMNGTSQFHKLCRAYKQISKFYLERQCRELQDVCFRDLAATKEHLLGPALRFWRILPQELLWQDQMM